MNKELTTQQPIDNTIEIIQAAPEALLLNQDTVNKAVTVCENLLKEIEEKGMTDELDAYCNKVQLRLKEVLSEVTDRRKPLTQTFDLVKKTFTELEAKIDPAKPDSVYTKIQAHRNALATKKAKERAEAEERQRRKLAEDQERDRLSTEAELQIRNGFIADLTEAKGLLQETFNALTLENFEELSDKVYNWTTIYLASEYDSIDVKLRKLYLTEPELEEIIEKARAGKFEAYSAEYAAAIAKEKQLMIDQLPGKKAYLEAEARAKKELEEKRRKAQEEQDEAARIKAEEDARKAEAEAKRLEEEKLRREEEKRIADAEEARRLEEEAKKKAEADHAIKTSQTLFDNELELKVNAPEPAVVESYEIEVKSAAGYLQIVSYYFTHKGSKEGVEDLEKRTLGQMKKFAETNFKKDGPKIDSPLIEYKPVYKVKATK